MAQRARCCAVESGGLVLRNSGRNRRNTSTTVKREGTRSARELAAEIVHETQGVLRGLMRDMQVDHGGGDLFVAEQFLDGVQMRACFEQMGSKGMPQRMDFRGREIELFTGGDQEPLQ